ncbi:MAG: ABC transporter permease [Oscillospiraceae bacterium]|nr:ABC transporter permease [Oscillospiraceae bacterium]
MNNVSSVKINDIIEKNEKENTSESKLTKKTSRIGRELNAVLTIAARDVTLMLKSPGLIIMSLAMPIVMMGMLGGSLSQNMSGGLQFNYGSFMMIGMLVNMLFMMTSMGLSSLVEDHDIDFTQEMMISPVSRYSIIVGKIIGSSFGAIIAMLGTLVVGFFMGITLSAGQLLATLALSPLMCLASGSFAVVIIGCIRSKKAANMAVTMITMAQMFLAGAIIPINNSSGILLVLNRIMPMTYCLDLVRSVVYAGSPEYSSLVMFNPAVNLFAIIALTAVFLIIGTFFFARSESHR